MANSEWRRIKEEEKIKYGADNSFLLLTQIQYMYNDNGPVLWRFEHFFKDRYKRKQKTKVYIFRVIFLGLTLEIHWIEM